MGSMSFKLTRNMTVAHAVLQVAQGRASSGSGGPKWVDI